MKVKLMMCEPSTIMTGMAIASAGLSYVEGQANARGVAERQREGLKTNYQSVQDSQIQTNQSAALDQSIRTKQGMAERSKVSALAGESGVLGLSSDRLVMDSFMQEGTDIATMEKNRTNEIDALNSKASQLQRQSQATINTAYNSAPSLIGTGLQIGSDTVKGTAMAKAQAKTKASV